MPTIVDMRRTLVERGDVDPLLQQTLQNFATQGNSYGKSARMRARWTKGLDFKIPDARKEPVEYVWFVGDFASFDERVQRGLAVGSRGSCTTPACRSGCSTRASATPATTCAGSARRACSRCSSSRT